MDKEKARGLLRLKVNGILSLFRVYGLDVFIPRAAEEIMKAIAEYESEIKEEAQ